MLLMARMLETMCVWVWMGWRKWLSGGNGSWQSFAGHSLDLEGPELTEWWGERVSIWIGLSFCRMSFLEHPLFLASSLSFLLSQVPVPQANFMEDIEKWLSTDVVSEGLLSWSQQSCHSYLQGWIVGSVQ